MRPPRGLASLYTRWLMLAFVGVELVCVVAFAWLVALPLAQRAADDLAGLMVLSAQTWVELPPSTRPAFEDELQAGHRLLIRERAPDTAAADWRAPFYGLLESALAQRTGADQRLLRSVDNDAQVWFWVTLPTGDRSLAVGVSHGRVVIQPLAALVFPLVMGLLMAWVLARWMARRLAAPLARLETASIRVGEGLSPLPLDESGPREIAVLSQRFNQMSLQVRDLLSARTTVLAGISHDLRTPLTRMRLALEMLRDKPSERLIDGLDRDLQQMNQLIANVLDLAQGLAHEPPQAVGLSELLQGLADEHGTKSRGVKVHCPHAELTVPVLALRRLLANLLQNALRHAPDGDVDLVCLPEPGMCRIGVLDRGPGIAPDQVQSMFLPFQRGEPSRSPQTGGSGLGLAIVKELARANGWGVRLEPRAGGGLEAWVDLHQPEGDSRVPSAQANSIR